MTQSFATFARIASCVSLAACAAPPRPRAPAPEFLTATAIVEHGPPSVDPAARASSDSIDDSADELPDEEPSTSLGDTDKPLPASRPSTKPTRIAPGSVVAQANDLASQVPEEDGFLNAIGTYAYQPGGFYKVLTAPMYVTDVALEPGEELLGPIVGGDPVRWWIDVGAGAVDGVPQKHIFIKPTRAGLRTNVTLTTDRRTYLLNLESVENTCDAEASGAAVARGLPGSPAAECTAFMLVVQWTYPQAASANAQLRLPSTEPATPSAATTDVTALHLDYAIEVINGNPPWRPLAVYDDGAHTYIRFEQRILNGEAPVLYVVERGEAQIVNYRVKGTLYIVDRIFDQAELRLGKDDQDVVRLRRRGTSGKGAPGTRNRATPPTPARFSVKRTPAR